MYKNLICLICFLHKLFSLYSCIPEIHCFVWQRDLNLGSSLSIPCTQYCFATFLTYTFFNQSLACWLLHYLYTYTFCLSFTSYPEYYTEYTHFSQPEHIDICNTMEKYFSGAIACAPFPNSDRATYIHIILCLELETIFYCWKNH